MDGPVVFRDVTAGTTLFSILFDDLQLVTELFTLEAGHTYNWSAFGAADLDPINETSIGKAFTFRLNAVPEPSTFALAGIGLGAVGLVRLRRRKRA